MYKILFATDGSRHSLQATGEVVRLGQALKAEVLILCVVQNIHLYRDLEGLPFKQVEEYSQTVNEFFLKEAGRILQAAENSLRENNIPCQTLIRQGHPAEVICQVAEEEECNLIVLGSSGKGGLKGLLLGSVSNRVSQCAKTNVYIVK